jgi:hypothetical protein
MKKIILVLLLIFVGQEEIPAQELSFPKEAVADRSTLNGAITDLAKRALVQRQFYQNTDLETVKFVLGDKHRRSRKAHWRLKKR